MAVRTVNAGNITGARRATNRGVAGSHSRKSSIALWSTQGVLAALFLFAGVSKLVMPAANLADQTNLPVLFIRFIGVCETAGALGLILPGVFGIKRGLAPLAAAGLVVIMIGATVVTVGDTGVAPAIFPFAVGVLAATIAYFRWQRLATTALQPAA